MSVDVSKDFFISYTHTDQKWAEWIGWQLEKAGYTTILQAWDFHAGGNFVLNMDTATKQARRTIAVLSPDYFASHFTPSEWAVAFRRDPKGEQGFLVPVRVHPCDVEGLLGQIVYIDLVGLDEQTAQDTLLARVKQERHKPTSAPAFPSVPSVLLERPSFPGALPLIWNIPYPRNPYFTGREELLSRLAEALRAGQTTALSQPQAVSGLGGIGKTQIALEYAYRHHLDYQAVLWTRADTQDALTSGFVAFADLLDLPQKDENDQRKIVQAVTVWLKAHNRWLLILDNADDLTLVKDFLPSDGGGHTLLTTRASSMGRLASRIEVDTLSQEAGALFLLHRAGLLASDMELQQAENGDRATAIEITLELGGLPLALDQAGAYIEEMQCSLRDYLQLYRGHRADLLKERGGLVKDHPEPVATTWSLSFSKIEQRNPAATDLLRLCAFLHPDAIPEEIITKGAEHPGSQLQTVAADPLAFNKAIQALLSYSLIRRDPAKHLLTIHRLVQAVLQDRLGEAERHLWAEWVVLAVNAAFPQVEVDHGTWPLCERLLPHALLAIHYIKTEQIISEEAGHVLHETATYLRYRARYAEALSLYLWALRIREQALGPEHSDVATSLNNLAILYYEQGRYVEAEPLYQRALRIREQQLGQDHSLVASVLNNLALLYCEQGKHVEAEPLYQRALRIREQQLGQEHPRVADLFNNLANLYSDQGKYAEAEPLYLRALHIWEEQLGLEHPRVANTLNNLATLYHELGKYVEAEPLYLRALHIWEEQMGSQHPLIATAFNNLANLYSDQGKYAEAELFYQKALRIDEQELRPGHPDTAEVMHDLARLREAQGNHEEARVWYARALAVREQALGPHHPKTIETRNHLITLLRAMGQYEDAAQLETVQAEQGMSKEEQEMHPEE